MSGLIDNGKENIYLWWELSKIRKHSSLYKSKKKKSASGISAEFSLYLRNVSSPKILSLRLDCVMIP